MTEHSFPPNDDPSRRCVHCGTTFDMHSKSPQNCVPHPSNGAEKLCPEPQRRILACEDSDAIATRIAELRKDRDEAMNHKADE